MNEIDQKARQSVFRNRDALREQYHPEEHPQRDDEWDELTDELMDAYWGSRPDDLAIYGPNGAGKTTVVRKALDGYATAEGAEATIITERVNCSRAKSHSEIARRAVNAFRPEPDAVKRGDHDVFPKLWRELDALATNDDEDVLVLLALDELGRADGVSDLFYELSRANDEHLSDVTLATISISSDPTIFEDLDSDSESSYDPTEIRFDPYGVTDLQTILKHRAHVAFRDTELEQTGRGLEIESDVLSDDVIPLTAARATRDGAGDARKALGVLDRAGKLAFRADDEVVTEEHVNKACDEYELEAVLDLLEDASDEVARVAYAVVSLAEDGIDKPSTTNVYKRYRRLVQHGGYDPVKRRTVQKHLNRLDTIGFTSKREQRGQGNPNVHPISGYSTEKAMDALEAAVDFFGAHEHLPSNAVTATGGD